MVCVCQNTATYFNGISNNMLNDMMIFDQRAHANENAQLHKHSLISLTRSHTYQFKCKTLRFHFGLIESIWERWAVRFILNDGKLAQSLLFFYLAREEKYSLQYNTLLPYGRQFP